MSPRNSPQAVEHLLTKSGATHLFVSSEAAIQSLADAALAQLPLSKTVEKCAMPTFDVLFPIKGFDQQAFVPEQMGDFSLDDIGLVLHSSGLFR